MKKVIPVVFVMFAVIATSCGSLTLGGKAGRNDGVKEPESKSHEERKAVGKLPPSVTKRSTKDRTAPPGDKKGDSPVKAEHDIASGLKKERTLGSAAKPPTASGLKAGFADDNRQFNYYIHFLRKYGSSAVHYEMNVDERIFIRVNDQNKKSIANADVKVFDGRKLLCSGKTYADGSFLFFPSQYGKSIKTYRIEVDYLQKKKEAKVDRQGPRTIEIRLPMTRSLPRNIPLDIVFIMDTTGSMGEEINRLKNTIEIINLNLAELSIKPKIRFGMVLYKDVDDEYVTRVIQLTGNLNDFIKELEKVEASGGGDGPEDLQSALADAIKKIKWNNDGIRLCYLVTDAPPHLDYGQKYTYVDAAQDARKKGIKFFSVGTGGLNIMGEYVLRQLSQFTYAKYIFLTYGEKGESEGGREGSVSHHTGTNFQTDKLESIIIRFTKEELAHISDQKIDMGDPFIKAVKVDYEKSEETLQKLFAMSITQLIDYSSIGIEKETPATLIPFNPSTPGLKGNAEYFTEQMSFSLNRNKTFRIVERKELQKVLKELELQYTGLMKDENAVKVGKLIGAKMIIGGTLYDKKDAYEIFLKLLRVETGEVLSVNKLKIDKTLGIR